MTKDELGSLIYRLGHAKRHATDWVTMEASSYIVDAKDLATVIALLKLKLEEQKEI